MKKIEENKVVIVNRDDYNGVELLCVIEFLEWLGYDVILKGGVYE